MTTTRTEYGTYEHGKPWASGIAWRRTDKWTSNKGEVAHEQLFASGPNDDSPIYQGQYNYECSCCHLGFAHTEAAHELKANNNRDRV